MKSCCAVVPGLSRVHRASEGSRFEDGRPDTREGLAGDLDVPQAYVAQDFSSQAQSSTVSAPHLHL